ncbi:MAG: hypothetical protein ACI381_07345 [Candidatus Methanomethylophilaceae archaeon]
MTEIERADGAVIDIELDLDAITAYEEVHPDWSIADMMSGGSIRITTLNLMASFIGYPSYKEFIDSGFKLDDLLKVITSSKYLGFSTTKD